MFLPLSHSQVKICSSIEESFLFACVFYRTFEHSDRYENKTAKHFGKHENNSHTRQESSNVSVLSPQHLMHHWITEPVWNENINQRWYFGVLSNFSFGPVERTTFSRSIGWFVWIHTIWMEQLLSVCQFIDFGWCQIQNFSREMCVAQRMKVENGLPYRTHTESLYSWCDRGNIILHRKVWINCDVPEKALTSRFDELRVVRLKAFFF